MTQKPTNRREATKNCIEIAYVRLRNLETSAELLFHEIKETDNCCLDSFISYISYNN